MTNKGSDEEHHVYFRISEYIVENLAVEGRITISRRDDTKDVWAIINGGHCLNRDGVWEWEPSPSNRDEAFIERTRFPLFVAMKMVEEKYGQVDKKSEPA